MIRLMGKTWGASLRTQIPGAGRWLADHILGALIALIVAAGVGATVAILWPGEGAAPPLASQWEHERAMIADEGWEITTDHQVEMQGNTQPTTILGLHRVTGKCPRSNQPSDEIRAYDVKGGRLQSDFAFQPTETGCGAWIFRLAKTADLTGSGREVVFAEFLGGSFGGPGESIPVAISWSAKLHHYSVVPLITEPPSTLLSAKNAEGQKEVFQARSRRMFITPVRLTSKSPLAYGATEFRFAPHGEEESFLYGLYRLTSGVAATGPSGPTAAAAIVYQRAMWHLEAAQDTFAAGWCDLSLWQEMAVVPFQAEPSSILARLVKHGKRWINSCEAPLLSKWWESHHG